MLLISVIMQTVTLESMMFVLVNHIMIMSSPDCNQFTVDHLSVLMTKDILFYLVSHHEIQNQFKMVRLVYSQTFLY